MPTDKLICILTTKKLHYILLHYNVIAIIEKIELKSMLFYYFFKVNRLTITVKKMHDGITQLI